MPLLAISNTLNTNGLAISAPKFWGNSWSCSTLPYVGTSHFGATDPESCAFLHGDLVQSHLDDENAPFARAASAGSPLVGQLPVRFITSNFR
jgi:hypothetical protein